MTLDRDSGGQFVSEVTDDDVMDFIEGIRRPFVTTSRVVGAFDIDQSTAYRRLQSLANDGRLNKEKVGANAVVWWPTEADADRERDYLKSFGKYADTNIAETAEAVSERFDRDLRERREQREQRASGEQ